MDSQRVIVLMLVASLGVGIFAAPAPVAGGNDGLTGGLDQLGKGLTNVVGDLFGGVTGLVGGDSDEHPHPNGHGGKGHDDLGHDDLSPPPNGNINTGPTIGAPVGNPAIVANHGLAPAATTVTQTSATTQSQSSVGVNPPGAPGATVTASAKADAAAIAKTR